MDNNLQVYSNNSFSVRTITDASGITWFVAKDVAEALEYSDASNPARLFASVPDTWKGVKPIHTLGGTQEMTCLTEQGLYFFLGRSDKPKALPYQMWIAGDVVPSIRRTGRYEMKKKPEIDPGLISAAKFILETAGIKDNQLVLALDKVYKHYTGNSALEMTGIELPAPEQQQLLIPTEIGKQLGLNGRRVNEILVGMGYQYKINGSWEAIGNGINYSVMLDVGKSHSDGTPVRQLKWNTSIVKLVKERL